MMTNSWKLSRPVFGLLMYFTTKNVFAANETCSQVISNSTIITNCTMNSTVQYTPSKSVMASNISPIQIVPTTTTNQTTVSEIATGMSSVPKVPTSVVPTMSVMQNPITSITSITPITSIGEKPPQTSAPQAIATSVGAEKSQSSVNKFGSQNVSSTATIVATLSLKFSPTPGQALGNSTTLVASPVAPPTSLLATTAAPTTPTASPTVHPANYPRTVKFEFPGNCSDFYTNSSTEKTFREDLKKSIASKANLNVSNMNDFNLTCGSIRVSFMLTPDASNSSAPSVNDSITRLSNLIQSGNLQITLPDGRNLTADNTSLVIITIVPTGVPTGVSTVVPTTTPTPSPTPSPSPTVGKAPTPTSSPLSTGAIIGIVIGCIVACLIILIVVYIFCCRKNTVLNGESNELQQTSGKANLGHA